MVISKLKSDFDIWKKQNNQHGRQAFSRFIMLTFLDGLQLTSEEFVFKGGNLLWHYIKTPRETVDLDLSTETLKSHRKVREILETSFQLHDEIEFKIKEFQELDGTEDIGAKIILEYSTILGQRNQFVIDVVYALPTDLAVIKSTIDGSARKSASIENIIADKLSAAHRFKTGNTRMKDFDDLWRISKANIEVNSNKLLEILALREIPQELNSEWIDFLEGSWKRHSNLYKDIPKDLRVVFRDINKWLTEIFS